MNVLHDLFLWVDQTDTLEIRMKTTFNNKYPQNQLEFIQ